jgi:transposase
MSQVQKQEMKLRDEQWQKLEPLLTGKQSDPGANAKNNRLFIEGVLWIVLNNSLWRHLPQRFGSSSTAYWRKARPRTLNWRRCWNA